MKIDEDAALERADRLIAEGVAGDRGQIASMLLEAVCAEREACASEMDRRHDEVANTTDTKAAYRNAARAIRNRS